MKTNFDRISDRLIVALDLDDIDSARGLVENLSPLISTFKVGSELFTAAGPDAVRMIHDFGCRVFLDLKFFDIPTTVSRAVHAASRLGVFMLNLHALGGSEMMKAAGEAAQAAATDASPKPLVLGVTILTSLGQDELSRIGFSRPIDDAVAHLAGMAHDSGLDGVVASPLEVKQLKSRFGKDFIVVTPGIRPAWSESHDQKRVMTPQEALGLGADYIVVGRPITGAENPRDAARRILEDISLL
jgi:orotidine-5'-phosphate decarboxylase